MGIDEQFLLHAINLAKQAQTMGEVPVGAVLVHENKIIAEGFNQPISQCDPTAHAEIIALRQGAKILNNYRLLNTTLYVTLEPCAMCIGALIHARVKRLVYGALDSKAGAIESIFQIANESRLNHRLECQGGILAKECGNLLTEFFRSRR